MLSKLSNLDVHEIDTEEPEQNYVPLNLNLINGKRKILSAPLSMKGERKINFMNFEPKKNDLIIISEQSSSKNRSPSCVGSKRLQFEKIPKDKAAQ